MKNIIAASIAAVVIAGISLVVTNEVLPHLEATGSYRQPLGLWAACFFTIGLPAFVGWPLLRRRWLEE